MAPENQEELIDFDDFVNNFQTLYPSDVSIPIKSDEELDRISDYVIFKAAQGIKPIMTTLHPDDIYIILARLQQLQETMRNRNSENNQSQYYGQSSEDSQDNHSGGKKIKSRRRKHKNRKYKRTFRKSSKKRK